MYSVIRILYCDDDIMRAGRETAESSCGTRVWYDIIQSVRDRASGTEGSLRHAKPIWTLRFRREARTHISENFVGCFEKTIIRINGSLYLYSLLWNEIKPRFSDPPLCHRPLQVSLSTTLRITRRGRAVSPRSCDVKTRRQLEKAKRCCVVSQWLYTAKTKLMLQKSKTKHSGRYHLSRGKILYLHYISYSRKKNCFSN